MFRLWRALFVAMVSVLVFLCSPAHYLDGVRARSRGRLRAAADDRARLLTHHVGIISHFSL